MIRVIARNVNHPSWHVGHCHIGRKVLVLDLVARQHFDDTTDDPVLIKLHPHPPIDAHCLSHVW
jgi:hypothetical protein